MRLLHLSIPLFVSTSCYAQNPGGPDAPSLFIEYDGSALHFSLSNPPGSNNVNGGYIEAFAPTDPTPDPNWRFQGYVIYELAVADTNDSLAMVIQDPERARVIGMTDVADAVQTAWNNFIVDGDSCVVTAWDFDNDGPLMVMGAAFSAITGLAWNPNGTYCFVATAFATTPHYIDSDCGTEQTMLFSRVLHPQCITPATVGMTEELSAPARIWPNPVTDELRIQLPNASSWQATCFDALGRAVLHDIVQAQDRIATAALPNGTYQIVLRATDGSTVSARFVVAR